MSPSRDLAFDDVSIDGTLGRDTQGLIVTRLLQTKLSLPAKGVTMLSPALPAVSGGENSVPFLCSGATLPSPLLHILQS